ncbi:MAG: glycoside hydrolase family 16 protein [Paramuribaculum sp.]|nr:glycoside hydrolase family 16 protein [Paramuribaculum sp.]
MKKLTALATILMFSLLLSACSKDDNEAPANPNDENKDDDTSKSWVLEWSDDFNGPALDETVWSRIPAPDNIASAPDWMKNQSTDDRCYEFRDGVLALKGIVNNNNESDSRPTICGGIWTTGKKAFAPGRIVIRARLVNGAQGAWPAMWMMPFKATTSWPACGEIDILERLNHDQFIYQTIHSHYANTLGRTDPPKSKTVSLDPSQWHEYELYIKSKELIFRIDGRTTFEYPKVNNGADNQFPFYTSWDLRLDMQLGGSWVGAVDPAQLPVEMEIDWVKYYQWK